MYAETEGSRKTIGDLDVVYHDGLYHLFHLVLPNHDFIAHAVSTNGLDWRRVNNALFVGDPGSWDDLMLWTMHVSPDPHRPGGWRMFYTGLSRREQGRLQRIGLATSDDLYHWKKEPVAWLDTRGPGDPELVRRARTLSRRRNADEHHALFDESAGFPLAPDPRHYEASLDEGRHWVSFRDPFYFRDGDQGWLLASARVKDGPIIRRGCVGLLEETATDRFEARPPLLTPRLYDDVEVPSLFQIDGEYYLIGSIREDAKIRYWHSDALGKPWRSYYDNVLMARGNYAGRVTRDENGWLLWNFFVMDGVDRTTHNVMPPPKRLFRTGEGLLRATTFEELGDKRIERRVEARRLHRLKNGAGSGSCESADGRFDLESESGFQGYVFDEELACFRFRARLELQGRGKCGLVFRVDRETHDGYYLSLDLGKGVARLRGWRTGPESDGEKMMQFESLQNGYWPSGGAWNAHVQLLAFGSYLELSIDGHVLLSLVDQTFEWGLLGVYLESARLALSEVELVEMRPPSQSDDHLVTGWGGG